MGHRGSEAITVNTLFRQYTAEEMPYSSRLMHGTNDIFLCEACLTCLSTLEELREHNDVCPCRYWIPGDEIYRCQKSGCVVFEIDGRKMASVSYTRRIAQLAKLFLEDKTTLDFLHFFAFLVLFEVDNSGYHFSGYFSREWRKCVSCNNSLSCVMVLPPYRSKGYGALLIEMSYEMGRLEGFPGTPERPLSRSGKCVFQRIWGDELLRALSSLDEKGLPVTVKSISEESGMTLEDVSMTLRRLNVVYSVTKHIPSLCVSRAIANRAKAKKRLNKRFLSWMPLF